MTGKHETSARKANVVQCCPRSLTSIVAKVTEHCIVSNMVRHLEDNNILYPSQNGFRSRLSTETQLVTFVDELTSEVSCGGQLSSLISAKHSIRSVINAYCINYHPME